MKLRFTLKGGPGSGHYGHSGRPGKVGGSSSDGGTSDKLVQQNSARQAIANLPRPNIDRLARETNPQIADIVYYAIENLRESPIKSPAGAFVDAVEDQNYYGSDPHVVEMRNSAFEYYKKYLAAHGIEEIEEHEYMRYNRSQEDYDEEDYDEEDYDEEEMD